MPFSNWEIVVTLAPVLAELVANFLDTGAADPEVFVADPDQR
jgi:hypothetical protein